MNIIVTGATGFVGKALVDKLVSQGDAVTVVVRDIAKARQYWGSRVGIVQASCRQFKTLNRSDFNDMTHDIFFHLAWAGTSGIERADIEMQLENVRHTCDAVSLARRLGCSRFVNAGSIMEYEVMQYIPRDGSRPGMGNIYSSAKLAADFMAKTVAVQNGVEYINVLISNIYGAGETSERFLNTTVRKMLKDEPVSLTEGLQLYDFIYISDAVRAIALAGKSGKKDETYYIGNTGQKPLRQFVMEMKETLHSQSQMLFGEISFAGAMLSYEEFDVNKLSALGFVPEITFAQGVRLVAQAIMEEENE